MTSHEAAGASAGEKVTVTSVSSIKSGKVKVSDSAQAIVISEGGKGEYGQYRNTQLIAERLSALVESIIKLPNSVEVLRIAYETALEHAGQTTLEQRPLNPKSNFENRRHEKRDRMEYLRTAIARKLQEQSLNRASEANSGTIKSALKPKSLLEQKMASPVALRLKVFNSATWLTSAEISHNAGYSNVNKSAAANKWKKAGDVFCVAQGGKDMFPSYIFGDDGKPLPCVGEILKRLGSTKSPLAVAAWFASVNGWLGGKAPMDVLLQDPQAVINAAAMEGSPSEHG